MTCLAGSTKSSIGHLTNKKVTIEHINKRKSRKTIYTCIHTYVNDNITLPKLIKVQAKMHV